MLRRLYLSVVPWRRQPMTLMRWLNQAMKEFAYA